MARDWPELLYCIYNWNNKWQGFGYNLIIRYRLFDKGKPHYSN